MRPFSVAAALASSIALTAAAAAAAPSPVGSERPAPAVRPVWLDGPTWYAVAGSFRSKADAEARASRLGDPWIVQSSAICANYAKGLWVVAAGAFDGAAARALATPVGGYAKECL